MSDKPECKIVVTIQGKEFVMTRNEVIRLILALTETIGYQQPPSLPMTREGEEWWKQLPNPQPKEKLGEVWPTIKPVVRPNPFESKIIRESANELER